MPKLGRSFIEEIIHQIVAHEATNSGSDRRQLHNMALQAKQVIANRGYFKREGILAGLPGTEFSVKRCF